MNEPYLDPDREGEGEAEALESIPEPRSMALELAATVYASDDPPGTAEAELDALGDSYDLERLCSLRNFLDNLLSAGREARKAVDSAIARELGANAGVRYGDQVFIARGSRKFVVKDPDALVAFAGPDFHRLINIVNNVRVTSLRALIKERGHSPKTLDTFGAYEDDGQALTVMPTDKAPKVYSRLEDGQRSIPKSTKQLGSTD